jgi:hypothetical protein
MATATTEKLMTYVELAKSLSIKPESARKMVQRRRWAKVLGNDGITRVRVPWEAVPETVTGIVPSDTAPIVPPQSLPEDKEKIAHLEGVIEGMQRELVLMEKRVQDAAEDRDAWRQQAQRSLWSKLFRDR